MAKIKEPLELIGIFDAIKSLMELYAPMFTIRTNAEEAFDLWSEKNIEIGGRKYTELFFAGLRLQKNYIGFYFMPVYCEPTLKQALSPDFLKMIKGKTCFHIKDKDPQTLAFIKEALKMGFENYQQKGWV